MRQIADRPVGQPTAFHIGSVLSDPFDIINMAGDFRRQYDVFEIALNKKFAGKVIVENWFVGNGDQVGISVIQVPG